MMGRFNVFLATRAYLFPHQAKPGEVTNTALIFSVDSHVGALQDALNIFKVRSVLRNMWAIDIPE